MIGHREVGDDKVGMEVLRLLDGISAVLGLPAHFEIYFTYKEFAQSLTNSRTVVHY
jgi:hypothetical protein